VPPRRAGGLFYVLARALLGGVSGWGWVFVLVGFLLDVGHLAGSGYSGRRRYASMA
jgi:hypothetical protein